MGSPRIDLNVHPELRPQLDAESLVMELFNRGFEQPPEGSAGGEFQTVPDGLPKVLVFNEIDVDVDAYAQATDVVVFHVEPPVFAGRRHRSRMWDCWRAWTWIGRSGSPRMCVNWSCVGR